MKYTRRQIKEAIAYWEKQLREGDDWLPVLPGEDGEDDYLSQEGCDSGIQAVKDTLGDFFQKAETAIKAAGVKVYGEKLKWSIGDVEENLTDRADQIFDIIEKENHAGRWNRRGVAMFSKLDNSEIVDSFGSGRLRRRRFDCLDEIVDKADKDGYEFIFAGYPLVNSAEIHWNEDEAWYENYSEERPDEETDNRITQAVNKMLKEEGLEFLECGCDQKTDSVWDKLYNNEGPEDIEDDDSGCAMVYFYLYEKKQATA